MPTIITDAIVRIFAQDTHILAICQSNIPLSIYMTKKHSWSQQQFDYYYGAYLKWMAEPVKELSQSHI